MSVEQLELLTVQAPAEDDRGLHLRLVAALSRAERAEGRLAALEAAVLHGHHDLAHDLAARPR